MLCNHSIALMVFGVNLGSLHLSYTLRSYHQLTLIVFLMRVVTRIDRTWPKHKVYHCHWWDIYNYSCFDLTLYMYVIITFHLLNFSISTFWHYSSAYNSKNINFSEKDRSWNVSYNIIIHKYSKSQACIFINKKNFNIFVRQWRQWKKALQAR